jgi:hypothetical protein
MKRAFVLFGIGVLGTAPALAQARPSRREDPVLEAIWREGTENSQLERLAQALMDSVGPRLNASPLTSRGTNWLVATYGQWGIEARNEQYGTWRRWRRGTTHIDLMSSRGCARSRGRCSPGATARRAGDGRRGRGAAGGRLGRRVRGLAAAGAGAVRGDLLPAADLPAGRELGALGDARVVPADDPGAGAGDGRVGGARSRDRAAAGRPAAPPGAGGRRGDPDLQLAERLGRHADLQRPHGARPGARPELRGLRAGGAARAERAGAAAAGERGGRVARRGARPQHHRRDAGASSCPTST